MKHQRNVQALNVAGVDLASIFDTDNRAFIDHWTLAEETRQISDIWAHPTPDNGRHMESGPLFSCYICTPLAHPSLDICGGTCPMVEGLLNPVRSHP